MKRKSEFVKVLAVVLAAVFLTDCATLIHGGGTQTISVNTEPPGATVKVGGQDLIAPAEVTLDRNRDFQVVAMKDGYDPATTTIQSRFSRVTVLDIIFILPWVIDLVSGSAYTLSPDTVNLVLNKTDRDMPGAVKPSAASSVSPASGAL
jgi:hypothetical protein